MGCKFGMSEIVRVGAPYNALPLPRAIGERRGGSARRCQGGEAFNPVRPTRSVRLKPRRPWLLKVGLARTPARQRDLDGMLKWFPACRALPLCQLAKFSKRPFDRPNLARSREKVLHGAVDFRHAWVIAPASEKARESKQRDGGGGAVDQLRASARSSIVNSDAPIAAADDAAP